MEKISCFGDICPVPLLKAIKSLKNTPSGETIMVVTDHSCVVESMEEYFASAKYAYSTEEVMNGVWEISITKLK